MDMQSRTYIESIPTVEADFMQKIYLWMTFALTLTGFVAYRTTQSEFLLELIFSSSFGLIGLIYDFFDFFPLQFHSIRAKALGLILADLIPLDLAQ